MQHKRPPLPVIIILIVVIAIGLYFGIQALKSTGNGQLTASGTIEATTVNVAPEMSGKVAEVLVAEGQPVRMGDPLLHLDPSLLTAQRQIAQAGLESARSALLTAQSAHALAQAQYDAALISARAQEGSARLTDWIDRAPSRFDQPLWYFSRAEQMAAAQTEVETASQALVQAQAELDSTIQDLKNADFVEAETRLSEARIGYLVAKAVYDHAQATGGNVSPEDVQIQSRFITYRDKINIAKNLSGDDDDVLIVADNALTSAETELDDAQKAYNALLDTDAADAVLKARAVLSVAQERYETALDTWTRMQTGENSPQVKIAAAALDQASAVLGQAESAVQQAEANLALLDTQITKLTVFSPMDGIMLTRNVEPGEFVQPGAVVFAMADLTDLTITVYVPENLYGQISLNQQATVTVDSFPGVTFTATVVNIADQAEYTPRNVQTVEGRSGTMYAIKLKVSDPNGQLKPGMPADVVFVQ